ncbi:MFS general substrate transporter [Polychaeton citri CBS 116435]|uniref:MFS general substrate transporter n=1 Tax=Polychaeton citri CBS 116435 TaxID=1314669 RepID=A0A9P4Q3U3_9PEZI|nr:MFS general substrate transporter [Polychaeton citri CBS 116435]
MERTELSATAGSLSASGEKATKKCGHILDQESSYEHTAYIFRSSKKWQIICVIILCQISMNFNAAAYSSAKSGLLTWSGLTPTIVDLGGALFLIPYGVGCELWAPFSEEFGRRPIMQISLVLVTLCSLPCALANSFWLVLAFRILGGLASAGGSVTLAIVPDLFEDGIERQQATIAVVWSSVAGSVIGPVVAGFQAQYLSWRWNFGMQIILGVAAWVAHLTVVPETSSDVLLDKRAKYVRSLPEDDPDRDITALGPMESRGSLRERLHWWKMLTLMARPYYMLTTEPLVGCLSLLSGFADMLVYLSLDAFGIVLDPWGFSPVAKGLAFLPLLVGYFAGWLIYSCWYYRDENIRVQKRKEPDEANWSFAPERKLTLLCILVITLPIGLALMGLCTLGYHWGWHWIWLLTSTSLTGLANFAIYAGSIDYMIQAYGSEFSASATGGNGFCRDVLAGIAAFWAKPFFRNIKKGTKYQLAIPQFILAALAALLMIPVFVFTKYGSWFREHSEYASALANKREERREVRQEAISRGASLYAVSRCASVRSTKPEIGRGRPRSTIGSLMSQSVLSRPQSRPRSLPTSRLGSRANSPVCGRPSNEETLGAAVEQLDRLQTIESVSAWTKSEEKKSRVQVSTEEVESTRSS